MTVSTTTTYNEATGAGGVKTFYFTFRCDDSSWVKVYLDDAIQSGGFTVALNADQSASPGGSVTFTNAPDGYDVLIQRETPKTQATAYTAYDSFPADTHELQLDKTMVALQDTARDAADAVAMESDARIAGDAAEAAARAAADAALLASGAAPSNVGIALVVATGGTEPRTVADHLGAEVRAENFVGLDPTGVADSQAAIQAAIDYAASVGASKVKLGRGAFLLGSGIQTPVTGAGHLQTGMTIEGEGDQTVLLGSGFALVTLRGDGDTLRSLMVHSHAADASTIGVKVANGTAGVGNWLIDRCSIIGSAMGTGTGVFTSFGLKGSIRDSVIQIWGTCVEMDRSVADTYHQSNANLIIGSKIRQGTIGVKYTNVDNGAIVGCTLEGNTTGISQLNGIITVQASHFENTTTNWSLAGGHGVSLGNGYYSAAAASDVVIGASGGRFGSYSDTFNQGITHNGAAYCHIYNPSNDPAATSGSGLYHIVEGPAYYAKNAGAVPLVIGNGYDYVNLPTGVNIGGATNTIGKFQWAGAGSVADGGTVTHGVGSAPDAVWLTGTNPGDIVTVSAIGATTFTVDIKKHDGSAGSTQNIYWIAIKLA